MMGKAVGSKLPGVFWVKMRISEVEKLLVCKQMKKPWYKKYWLYYRYSEL